MSFATDTNYQADRRAFEELRPPSPLLF